LETIFAPNENLRRDYIELSLNQNLIHTLLSGNPFLNQSIGRHSFDMLSICEDFLDGLVIISRPQQKDGRIIVGSRCCYRKNIENCPLHVL